MGRAPCCEKVGLKRGPWTPEEDEKLVSFINEHGHGSWRALPKKAGLLRCGKSCRLRWTNYLRPDIKRGEFSASEEHAILQLHALLGNRWSAIASHLPKRTDNEIKNYWNTHLKKKLVKMGLDPITHKPLADSVLVNNSSDVDKSSTSGTEQLEKLNGSSSNKNSLMISGDAKASASGKVESNGGQLLLRGASPIVKGSSATMHLTQWESVRLEAEARLTQEAKMRAKGVWRRNEWGSSCAGGPTKSLLKASSCIHEAAGGNKHSVAGGLKAVSAMELMNALHNWEKSLQGQAGLLWPESWRVAASSCGHSESSSSSSPVITDAGPASSTSLDSRKPCTSERITTSTNIAPTHPHSPPAKLSWSDALMPPKYPKTAAAAATHDFSNLEASRRAGSFSSLMLDAVLGRSSLLQGAHGCGAKEELGTSDVKMTSAAADCSPDKHHLDEASNVSEITGDMQGDEGCTEDDGDDHDVNDDDDDDDERSLSVDGTSDLFKGLPRLKTDATMTPVSYTALLSEEISDYWSNIVLKEQVSSPTIHITF